MFFQCSLLAVVLATGVPAASAKPQRIVWQDAGHRIRYFTPQELLEDAGKSFSGAARLQKDLDRAVARRAAAAEPLECDQPPIGDVFFRRGEAPRPPTIADLMRTHDVAFRGRVIGVTPGWRSDQVGGHAASLVTLEALEVFTDQRSQLRPGDRVTYLQDAGRLTTRGVTLCTESSSFQSAQLGDSVVVIGPYDPHNQGHLRVTQTGVFFLNGDVAKVPRDNPLKAAAVSLQEVRQHARRLPGVFK